MLKKIETLKSQMLTALKEMQTEDAVRQLEVDYLGRKGSFNEIMRGLKDLSPEEKGTVGKAANLAKKEVEEAIAKRYTDLEKAALDQIAESQWLDVTMPGKKPQVGHRHLISQFMDDAEDIFAKMGFSVADGPEVEHEHYNFDQLNMPSDHPSRDMQDTFWAKNLVKSVLRTQTSPVQVRHMEAHTPPISVITMGKTFRKDSDATHSPMFHQLEGLMVGDDISMANLKSVLTSFFQQVFEDDSIKTRFRLSYFPFVEPGMEVDCTCPICKGTGKNANVPCRLCKQCGWLEVAGAGMVHPKVLENVGYDPEKLSGFAFGVGLDRMIMIKNHIPHLRLLFENDLRFNRQF